MGGSSCGKIGLQHYGHPIYQMTICPITCGLPTRMLKLTFASMCEGRRIEGTYCGDVCRGTLPPELTLVTLAEMNNELRMTNYELRAEQSSQENKPTRINKENDMTKEREKGTCGLCGQDEKNCRDTKGVSCCSTCEPVMRAAHNSPDAMFKALIMARGEGYLQEMVAHKYGGEVPERIDDLSKIKADLAASQFRLLLKLKEILLSDGEEFNLLNGDHDFLLDVARQLKSDLSRLREENIDVNNQVQELTDRLTAQVAWDGPVEAVLMESHRFRDSILLDLALDVLAGKVNGLDADRLAQLRVA